MGTFYRWAMEAVAVADQHRQSHIGPGPVQVKVKPRQMLSGSLQPWGPLSYFGLGGFKMLINCS